MVDERYEHGWKPNMKSEFSMGMLDFQRYDMILRSIDEMSIQVSMSNPQALIPFYAALWDLYKNFRPVLIPIAMEKYDKQFNEVKNLVYNEMNVSNDANDSCSISQEIIEKLDNLHIDLLQMRQIIGLGIVLTQDLSFEERLRKGLRL